MEGRRVGIGTSATTFAKAATTGVDTTSADSDRYEESQLHPRQENRSRAARAAHP